MGTIQQQDLNLVNIYVLNIGTPKYVKQILMDIKGEINRNIVIVGDVDTLLTSMSRSSRQKNQQTAALKHTLDQIDLIDIFRVHHSQTAKHTYFPSAHGKFSRIDHICYKNQVSIHLRLKLSQVSTVTTMPQS
ncbi:hypothetical protein HJG60_011297 [Phyllostomus discolor]|uniref:Uncharacterized protein n=1 Tax=Phyllostomus discolor TaxID=89673 RepID=A0A834A2C1_9CHIR|nr:hypothetical protein HJG60_011297 [Phyllostomus discolor]